MKFSSVPVRKPTYHRAGCGILEDTLSKRQTPVVDGVDGALMDLSICAQRHAGRMRLCEVYQASNLECKTVCMLFD